MGIIPHESSMPKLDIWALRQLSVAALRHTSDPEGRAKGACEVRDGEELIVLLHDLEEPLQLLVVGDDVGLRVSRDVDRGGQRQLTLRKSVSVVC